MSDYDDIKSRRDSAYNELKQIKLDLVRLTRRGVGLEALIVGMDSYLKAVAPEGTVIELELKNQADMPNEITESDEPLTAIVQEVLKEAKRPMRAVEIWEAAALKGAKTASEPAYMAAHYTIRQLLRNGAPIKKVGKGLWKYTGGTAD